MKLLIASRYITAACEIGDQCLSLEKSTQADTFFPKTSQDDEINGSGPGILVTTTDPGESGSSFSLILLVDVKDQSITSVLSTFGSPVLIIIYSDKNLNQSSIIHQRCYGVCDDSLLQLIAGFESFNRYCEMPYLTKEALKMLKFVQLKTVPDFLVRYSQTAQDINLKVLNMKDISCVNLQAEFCSCAKSLRLYIALAQILFNTFTGILVLVCILFYGPFLSSFTISYTEAAVKNMLLLLDWMMGVPAGLKLNYRLTVFLGRFFTFHVWLWAEYLKLFAVKFELIMKVVGVLGVFGGASLQLALVQDLISIVTLHLLCFYIYSARLYSLVVHTLLSLSRLFRGLKWNTLRLRVDHASYDLAQLFLGTLLFSILLFLFPTVFLYYMVFTMFRLLVATFQGIIWRIRLNLTGNFVLLRLLVLMKSCCIKDKYRIRVCESSKGEVTVVYMDELLVSTYSDTLQILKLPAEVKQFQLIDFLSKLAQGQLV